MSAPKADAPTTPQHPGALVGILIALAAVTLRMCDAGREAELSNAIAGAGLGGSGGASAIGSHVIHVAIGVGIVFVIARVFRTPGAALPVVIVGSLIASALVYTSTAAIARRRSHAIDSWSLCESPGTSPAGHSTYVSTLHRTSRSHDGPHLENGDPCVSTSEQRDVHERDHPDGDVLDGLGQVMYRFPRDRMRVIYLPAALLAGLLLAIGWTVVYERRRRRAR